MEYILILPLLLLLVPRYKNFNNNFIKFNRFIFLIILIFFSGLRYNVGQDYHNYSRIFLKVSNYGSINKDLEFLFKNIIVLLNKFNLNYPSLFLVMSFLTIVILYITIRDLENEKNIKLSFFGALFIFLTNGHFFSSFNGIRQFLAIIIFLFSTRYIYKKKFFMYFICLILASMFHYSAILLLPLYFIGYKDFKIGTWFVLYFVSFLFYYVELINVLIMPIKDYIPFGYSVYFSESLINKFNANAGFTFLFRQLLGFIIILSKNRFINNKRILPYFNFYTFGVLLNFILLPIPVLYYRINMYFSIFSIIIIPYFVQNVFRNRKNKKLLVGIFGIIFIILYIKISLYNIQPYSNIIFENINFFQ